MKNLVKLILAFSTILLVVKSISGNPYPKENDKKQGKPGKKGENDGETDNSFLEDFKKYVEQMPITSFEGDALLIQFPDFLGGKTTYRHLDASSVDRVIYETQQVDVDENVVILTSKEDGITAQPKWGKRIYVVLKRALNLDPRAYYAAYVYVSDAPKGRTGIHNLGDRKVFIEWDFWDHREVATDTRAKQLENAFGCSNTIFIPCSSNETIDFPALVKPKSANVQDLAFLKPTKTPKDKKPSKASAIKVADGYDPNELADVYFDIENAIKQGKAALIEARLGEGSPTITGRGISNDIKVLASDLKDAAKDMKAAATEWIQGAAGVIKSNIDKVLQLGMGLVKSFGGLFGGLGTSEATPESVETELGIEGGGSIQDQATSQENAELVHEFKLPSSGGLGGLINLDEEKESGSGPKGRSIGGADDAWTQLDFGGEKPYVQYGWRMANDVESANDPFVGFGGCRYHKVTTQDLADSKTEEDLIHVFQTALKTQCIKYETDFLLEILSDRLLKTRDDRSLDLMPDAPHFKTEKLNVKQLKELLRGLELYIFSKAYLKELKSPTSSPTTPDGATISRSVYTLGQSIIIATSLIHEHSYPLKHAFKVGRNLVKTLTTAYLKLLEDMDLFGDGDSALEKEINFNDRVYVLSLVQYLIHGVTPLVREPGTVTPQKNFEDFYKKNKLILEDMASS